MGQINSLREGRAPARPITRERDSQPQAPPSAATGVCGKAIGTAIILFSVFFCEEPPREAHGKRQTDGGHPDASPLKIHLPTTTSSGSWPTSARHSVPSVCPKNIMNIRVHSCLFVVKLLFQAVIGLEHVADDVQHQRFRTHLELQRKHAQSIEIRPFL